MVGGRLGLLKGAGQACALGVGRLTFSPSSKVPFMPSPGRLTLDNFTQPLNASSSMCVTELGSSMHRSSTQLWNMDLRILVTWGGGGVRIGEQKRFAGARARGGGATARFPSSFR